MTTPAETDIDFGQKADVEFTVGEAIALGQFAFLLVNSVDFDVLAEKMEAISLQDDLKTAINKLASAEEKYLGTTPAS